MLNGKDWFNHVVTIGGTEVSDRVKDGSKGNASIRARLPSST